LIKEHVMQISLPSLDYATWKDTCTTLHLWTQIVGKIRLVQTPWVNHSWHVPLYVTARGLTTSPIPYGERSFEIELDLIGHELVIRTNAGSRSSIQLAPRSVADFYRELMERLGEINIHVEINRTPNEIAEAIPFDEDTVHTSYDTGQVTAFFDVLSFADSVFKEFRSRFIGKCSPVHFFWGSFDLAVTRFSGRTAPEHPGGVPNLPDWVAREAYSHEVSSLGFWPGSEQFPHAAFYSYAYPEPDGFRDAETHPDSAYFNTDLGEFILPYEAVRSAVSPREPVLDFAQTTYEAAANNADWDRAALEKTDRRR
jgi:hypothetical protein